MSKKIFFSLAVAALIFSGCSQKSPELDSGATINAGLDSGNVPLDGLGNDTIDAGIDGMEQVDTSSSDYGSDSDADQYGIRPIYFGTDRYDISATEMQKLEQDANILNGELSGSGVKVEGNCDEWGSDEYNYALGLKRARSTKRALISNGVDTSRVSIISYGESKPICIEHNSECWQQNRRADIRVMQ